MKSTIKILLASLCASLLFGLSSSANAWQTYYDSPGCRWVPGYWSYGYWVPGYQQCWGPRYMYQVYPYREPYYEGCPCYAKRYYRPSCGGGCY